MTSTFKSLNKQHDHFHGFECPECGAREGIESDTTGTSYGCHGGNGCGAQWDRADYQLTDEEYQTLSA